MLLEIKNIDIFNEANSPILENVSLSIDKATINCLIGPNGSGKSSLAQLIIGYRKQENGSIIFNKEDISKLEIYQRARLGIFFVNQNIPSIDGLSVFTFLKESYKALINNSINIDILHKKILKAFNLANLDLNFLSREIGSFSGGEKKKFEIAQFILFKPALAIFDEIDSGLDIDSIKILLNAIRYIKNINKNFSLILISHSIELIEALNPDNIFYIKNRKIFKENLRFISQIKMKGFSEIQY